MESISLEIAVIGVLILANGFFSIAEFALISVRRSRLEQRAAAGSRGAAIALELTASPARLLSTVQTGVTLVGVFASAFGGATIADTLSIALERVPYVSRYHTAVALGIVVAVLSYLMLVFGELLPKRVGLAKAEEISIFVAAPMRVASRVASPAVRLLTLSTDWVIPLLGLTSKQESPITAEEVKLMIEHGTRAGVFEPAEKDIVARVLRLGDLSVGAMMTPRPDLVWLDIEAPTAETIRVIATSGHSRFPVCRGSLDDVLGIVRAKDILPRSLVGEPFNLEAWMREPLFVPNTMGALKALELFKNSAAHIALVVDEHGGVEGLITDHDLLEAVVGDVAIVDHPVEKSITRREDGSYLIDGMVTMEEFKELFGIQRLAGEERGDFHTIGGFVMQQVGRIPVSGDHFEAAGLRFEVMDMDGRRVDKVLVHPK
jgi:putative hemolysin